MSSAYSLGQRRRKQYESLLYNPMSYSSDIMRLRPFLPIGMQIGCSFNGFLLAFIARHRRKATRHVTTCYCVQHSFMTQRVLAHLAGLVINGVDKRVCVGRHFKVNWKRMNTFR